MTTSTQQQQYVTAEIPPDALPYGATINFILGGKQQLLDWHEHITRQGTVANLEHTANGFLLCKYQIGGVRVTAQTSRPVPEDTDTGTPAVTA